MEKTIDSMDVLVTRSMVDDGEYIVTVSVSTDEEGVVLYSFYSEQYAKRFETHASENLTLWVMLNWVKCCEKADFVTLAI